MPSKLIPVFIFFGLLLALPAGSILSWPVIINLLIALSLAIYCFVKKIFVFSFCDIKTKSFSANIFYALLLIAAILCLNLFANKNNFKIDLTENQIFSLSAESVGIVSRVQYPLKFIRLDDSNNSTRSEAQALIDLYQNVNPLISLELLDPQTAKKTHSYINFADPKLTYIEYQTPQIIRGHFSKFSESEISTAIFKITSTKARVACYLIGHGEPDPDSSAEDGLLRLTEFLKAQNIALVGLLPSSVNKIPTECEFLMVMPVKNAYQTKERELLAGFLSGGGQVLLLNDPESADDFNWLTEPYGIKTLKAVILDKQQELQGAPEVGWQFVVSDFKKNPVTRNLKGPQTPLVFLLGSPLEITDSSIAKELALSSRTSWGESNLNGLFSAKPEASFDPQSDFAGPLPVIALSEKKTAQDSLSRIIVVGENKWLNNANLEVYFNRDLLAGMLTYFAEKNSPELNFPAKLIRPSRISPISAGLMKNLMIAAFIIPELLLIMLLFLIYRRRKC